MKKLNEKVAMLIIDGVSCTGSYDPDEFFFHFEEKLTIKQSVYARAFLTWAYNEKLKFGSLNINKIYNEFKKSPAFSLAEKELNECDGSESNATPILTEWKPK